MDYMKMNINDIIKWCQENNQINWLKAKAKEEVEVKRYTGRVKVVNSKGKEVWVADKNSPKKTIKAPITFIQIKKDFVEKFMPEIKPVAKSKEKTMYDLISEL